MQRISILNSRQALRPTGAHSWVQATTCAIRSLMSESDCVFLSSLGEMTYELPLCELSSTGASVEIVVNAVQLQKHGASEDSLKNYLSSEFGLSPERTTIILIENTQAKYKNSSHFRDSQILKLADVLVPISIRPGGFWDEQLNAQLKDSASIDMRFAVEYQNRTTKVKQDYSERPVDKKTSAALDEYLIHWTRTSNRPWPGETRFEYYRAILEAQESYPRSAYATLRHILSQKRICSSTRHLASDTAMVSLTSASLAESVALMKYRARYREMTIEPFAIAIPISIAREIGAKEVSYDSPEEIAQLSDEDTLYAHSSGARGNDWRPEREWRIKGDVDLDSIWREVIALTENTNQSDELAKEFEINSLAVFE